MNLTPVSSIETPSAAILMRVSVSGTRLMQTAIFTGRSPSFECRQSRDVFAEDQRVHVVRTLVCVDALEVREVPHRAVLGEDAVGAEQAARLARALARHVHVVALGERDLLRPHRARVLQPAELEAEQL